MRKSANVTLQLWAIALGGVTLLECKWNTRLCLSAHLTSAANLDSPWRAHLNWLEMCKANKRQRLTCQPVTWTDNRSGDVNWCQLWRPLSAIALRPVRVNDTSEQWQPTTKLRLGAGCSPSVLAWAHQPLPVAMDKPARSRAFQTTPCEGALVAR